MQTTEEILKLAQKNQQQARQVIEETGVVGCWQSINARINLIGSLKTGLLMKHRDIDFHIYTPKLDIAESFRAVSLLAEHTGVIAVEYANLSDEEDACLEWHAKYRDKNGDCWQIDMIHMADGSRWDGYFEKNRGAHRRNYVPQTKRNHFALEICNTGRCQNSRHRILHGGSKRRN